MAEEKRREEYESYTVPALKALLRTRGFPVSGRKEELIERLLGDDAHMETLKEAFASKTADVVEPEAAEPKAARPAERPCETCGESFTPAKPEYQYCPKCFRAYRRRGAQEQAEKALTQVHEILSGIIERNTPSAGGAPWYSYAEAIELFEKAKAKYASGDFRNLVGDLYQGVLGKANEITAHGDLNYVVRLIDSEELEETPELQRLMVEADSFLADEKFREAAEKAREAKQLAGRLRREQGEAKKQELLDSLVFEPQSQRKRGGGSKKGLR